MNRRLEEIQSAVDLNPELASDGSEQSGGSSVDRGKKEARKEVILSGTILLGDDITLAEGYISIRNGLIAEIGNGPVDSNYDGIICPCFVNAHTHIGDSFFKDPPYLPLADLVGPGGLKHRMLASISDQEIVAAMRSSAIEMQETGTCAFADFREGGRRGVDQLIRALDGLSLISEIFGRPDDAVTFNRTAERSRSYTDRDCEKNAIHEACRGIGISSTRDFSVQWIRETVASIRKGGRMVAVHAGEADRDDIDDAIRLYPDIIVHLSKATESDLARVADTGASVVVCPRSNLITGSGLPDISCMIRLGLNVAVGTDNVMLNSTNMFREMELISKALLHDDRQVFKMCTLNGARALGIDERVGSICLGKEARVMVIDRRSRNMRGYSDPISSLVRRAEPSDILAVF